MPKSDQPLVVVPMAGLSTRFPQARPKWMLTHPMGQLMFRAAVDGLHGTAAHVVFVVREEHDAEFGASDVVHRQLQADPLPLAQSWEVLVAPPTDSQPATVDWALRQVGWQGPFLVKDCDNYFNLEVPQAGNYVAVADLRKMPTVSNPAAKSYVDIGGEDVGADEVLNIAEKEILGPLFCCGGYGFDSAGEFRTHYHALLEEQPPDTTPYVSHVIYRMMLHGETFRANMTDNYVDWGTAHAWQQYVAQFGTVFVDVDGCLLTNTGQFWGDGHRWGQGEPIRENIGYISRLYGSGRVKVVLATARPELAREALQKELGLNGVRYHKLLMGLPHGLRAVVNDVGTSNGRPAAAVAIARNSADLQAAMRAQGISLGGVE